MKKYILAAVLCLMASSAHAEIYTQEPHCAIFKNETKNTMFLGIRTDFYTKPDGKKSYHEEVLHIKPGNMQQACVKGPFFPDYKVLLSVKSFFPLYECKTRLEGEIYIREKVKENGNGKDYYATCVE